ncbi:DoxX family membrane protein [Aquicoccus sp. G2-2]|uniref:DoxX family membrane protein n=1 Tax=Aquicoccus sp. G2-2 TaxID=3092120 RepID=UPI002ADFA01F|nr:DoxX family membrane protein [Aquicoccus sp. G2-2]MEA1112699.1 DoxX family membrane protein [Aquicoccus sp. G2-2]
MTRLISLYQSATIRLEAATWLLPTLARFLFAAILLVYFWKSALTKLGDGAFGLISPSVGAYAQIFPRAFEAVGFDPSKLGLFHWAVTVAGTWAEFLLPLLLVLGLFTRLAALGMIGFVALQTLTDLYGHHLINEPASVGRWFDGAPDALIVDLRAFWVFLLITLVIKGAGPLSLDHLLRNRAIGAQPA